MQHSKVIIQEAQREIQYAQSYVILRWQMINFFITF